MSRAVGSEERRVREGVGVEGLEREKRVIEKELGRLGEETAGLLRMTGKLATDRMAELQDRVAVLERQFRDVRDQLAESAGQAVDAASVRKTLKEFDGVWSEMTPREQEKFVKTLVDRVTYDGATCTVTVGFRTAGIQQLCAQVENR